MTSTEHPVRQEELMAYLDGELTAERAAELAAHVEQCVVCRALVADLGSVSEQLVEWQVEPSPEPLAQVVSEAAQKRFAKGSRTEGARQFNFSLVCVRSYVVASGQQAAHLRKAGRQNNSTPVPFVYAIATRTPVPAPCCWWYPACLSPCAAYG